MATKTGIKEVLPAWVPPVFCIGAVAIILLGGTLANEHYMAAVKKEKDFEQACRGTTVLDIHGEYACVVTPRPELVTEVDPPSAVWSCSEDGKHCTVRYPGVDKDGNYHNYMPDFSYGTGVYK